MMDFHGGRVQFAFQAISTPWISFKMALSFLLPLVPVEFVTLSILSNILDGVIRASFIARKIGASRI
jgi:hypothetical protein